MRKIYNLLLRECVWAVVSQFDSYLARSNIAEDDDDNVAVNFAHEHRKSGSSTYVSEYVRCVLVKAALSHSIVAFLFVLTEKMRQCQNRGLFSIPFCFRNIARVLRLDEETGKANRGIDFTTSLFRMTKKKQNNMNNSDFEKPFIKFSWIYKCLD